MPGAKARGPELVSSGFTISILDEEHCRQVSGKAAKMTPTGCTLDTDQKVFQMLLF